MNIAETIDSCRSFDTVQASEIDVSSITGYKGIYNRIIKRGLDLGLSIIMTVCVSPILVATSIAILLEDGLPIFYRAERGGLHGRSFKIFKFRSMIKNADKIGGGTTALHDNRITKVGNVLRKTKIDENVIIGQSPETPVKSKVSLVCPIRERGGVFIPYAA